MGSQINKIWFDELASSAPTPGGGGASAMAGAAGAALGLMVSNLTVGKKKYAAVEDEIRSCMDKLEVLKNDMLGLIEADAEGFGAHLWRRHILFRRRQMRKRPRKKK